MRKGKYRQPVRTSLPFSPFGVQRKPDTNDRARRASSMVSFFLFYLLDHFFPIFCYTCQNIKHFCYTVFSYTRRFSLAFVIPFCYTWFLIEIFVIPKFVIPHCTYNQIKAKIGKIEDKNIVHDNIAHRTARFQRATSSMKKKRFPQG